MWGEFDTATWQACQKGSLHKGSHLFSYRPNYEEYQQDSKAPRKAERQTTAASLPRGGQQTSSRHPGALQHPQVAHKRSPQHRNTQLLLDTDSSSASINMGAANQGVTHKWRPQYLSTRLHFHIDGSSTSMTTELLPNIPTAHESSPNYLSTRLLFDIDCRSASMILHRACCSPRNPGLSYTSTSCTCAQQTAPKPRDHWRIVFRGDER